MLTLLCPEVIPNVELAISNNQSGSDERDYCEDADRPTHLNSRVPMVSIASRKELLSNQRLRERNGIKIYSLEKYVPF